MKKLETILLGHSSVEEDFTYAFGLYRIQAHCRGLGMPHPIRIFDRKVTDDEEEDAALILDAAPDVGA